jgi:hypothetical protein
MAASPVKLRSSEGKTDQEMWDELALGLVVNRTVPQYLADRVNSELRRVYETYPLPWEA